MATKTAPAAGHDEGTVLGGDAHHPTEKQYVLIAVFLAVVTAIEVALYYVDTGALNTPLLLIFAAVKFVVVVGWFMHLRFDSKIVRRLFVTGLVLAVAVYVAALATFGVKPWDRGEPEETQDPEDSAALVLR